MVTRQPIVSVLGHVDHGKTTVLDRIRGTSVVSGEAGGITQHIGATEVPLDAIEEICGVLMGDRSFTVPGLLFIDTPGHRAFTTLRSRGGALADIGVVVVDVQEGLMPQTREALHILKREKTPFVVAANKIDRIHGWDSKDGQPFITTVGEQTQSAQDRLQDAIYKLIGDLHSEGYPADRYDNINDFTKTIAVVPMAALTGEGMADLLLVLTGLAQRYLEQQGELEANLDAPGKATVLEVKEERGFGPTLDVILYDGKLSKGQKIVVGTSGEPIETTIRALLKPKPMDEIRDPSDRFDTVDEIQAACGVKVSAPDLGDVTPGAPLYGATPETADALKQTIASELKPDIKLNDDKGLFIKADTLGSLEALAFELDEADIPVRMARVGNVSARDVIEAGTFPDREDQCILAFGVDILPEVREELHEHEVQLVEGDIVYQIIEDYQAWVESTRESIEETARGEITFPGQFLFMENHTFRVRKPAIIGVRVLKGRIRQGQRILREDGRVVGQIQSIRLDDNPVPEAKQGDEVALAIEDVQVGRQMEEGEVYMVDIPGGDYRELERFDLTHDEQQVMLDVADIKREEDPFWGM